MRKEEEARWLWCQGDGPGLWLGGVPSVVPDHNRPPSRSRRRGLGCCALLLLLLQRRSFERRLSLLGELGRLARFLPRLVSRSLLLRLLLVRARFVLEQLQQILAGNWPYLQRPKNCLVPFKISRQT